MFDALPSQVTVYEVGPRDGLQNESVVVSTEVKRAWVQQLLESGIRHLEISSLVHPTWVPQLADAEALIAAMPTHEGLSVLVPNMKGYERAVHLPVREVAIVLSASETHNQKNIRKSVQESLDEYALLTARALADGFKVRAYISTAFGCPYEGKIAPNRVWKIAEQLVKYGAGELSFGDTIGVATPRDVFQFSLHAKQLFAPHASLALHLHNTRGTALANVAAALEAGFTVFDSSAGGLGGCPYAPGASGNLATEDLLYMLHGMGIATGIDLLSVCRATAFIHKFLNRDIASNVARSLIPRLTDTPEQLRERPLFI